MNNVKTKPPIVKNGNVNPLSEIIKITYKKNITN